VLDEPHRDGHFCCHQLAHMGIDVIKVEVPGTGGLA
jgi:formyl-CoA transferase